jgi:hypothetical protein
MLYTKLHSDHSSGRLQLGKLTSPVAGCTFIVSPYFLQM